MHGSALRSSLDSWLDQIRVVPNLIAEFDDSALLKAFGEASAQGIGFGFSNVTDGRLIGCRALGCEGDGYHLERDSSRWLCADLIARDVGIPSPVNITAEVATPTPVT